MVGGFYRKFQSVAIALRRVGSEDGCSHKARRRGEDMKEKQKKKESWTEEVTSEIFAYLERVDEGKIFIELGGKEVIFNFEGREGIVTGKRLGQVDVKATNRQGIQTSGGGNSRKFKGVKV